jgi:beta-1,2-mannobiose phosphorylase / 1,2-beta-oligomannan phosphorylase
MQVKTKIDVRRNEQNPLISPEDLKPSRIDFTNECVFNAGVARYKDEVILLMRVARDLFKWILRFYAYRF